MKILKKLNDVNAEFLDYREVHPHEPAKQNTFQPYKLKIPHEGGMYALIRVIRAIIKKG